MMDSCRLGNHFTRYRADLGDARKRLGKAHLGYPPRPARFGNRRLLARSHRDDPELLLRRELPSYLPADLLHMRSAECRPVAKNLSPSHCP